MAAILGLCFFIGGLCFYTQVAWQWQQSQSWLVQVAGTLSPNLQQQTDSIRTWYVGSIGAMIVGGLLTIAGIRHALSASANTPEKGHRRILETIGAALVVLGCLVVFQGLLGASPMHEVSASGASAVRAPGRGHGTAAAPTREVIHGLTQLGSLEWRYLSKYGTFTRDLGSLGFTNAVGSPYVVGPHYIYIVRHASESEVLIEATGKVRTHASGIKLALILTADGRSRAFRYP